MDKTTKEKSVFETLNEIDITADIAKKQNIKYLPWSKAWTYIKTVYPDAELTVSKREDNRFWFDDGKSAWVECSLTINGKTETEVLAVMDHRNQAIPAENVTAAQASNSLHRCIVKCAALHGLGLSLWTGEELSSAASRKKATELDEVKQEILSIVSAKLEAGVKREELYKVIESVAGNKNPNAIGNINTAQKVLDQIKKLEVK